MVYAPNVWKQGNGWWIDENGNEHTESQDMPAFKKLLYDDIDPDICLRGHAHEKVMNVVTNAKKHIDALVAGASSNSRDSQKLKEIRDQILEYRLSREHHQVICFRDEQKGLQSENVAFYEESEDLHNYAQAALTKLDKIIDGK
jgi:hypothetical protein